MSNILINKYYNNLDRAIKFGKSRNEQSIRNHFWMLLNEYARKQNYEVITEIPCLGTKGKKVYPDGIVKNLFGLDIGLWESKDEKDTIDDEIDAKLKKGYPFQNILFEDTQTAILFQHNEEVLRAAVRDAEKLHQIITKFITFKNEIIFKFEDALEKFKADIPIIVTTLRQRIDETSKTNKNFIAANETFLELCKTEINPEITNADVREMMIQHILTSDIFNKIFDDPEFHRHNNIARELEKLIEILFTYSERKNLMANIEHYYDAINRAAAYISDHHEKQKFLKVLYENFYKVYNPKAADRLGVIYTPNEIVQFMIESAEYLLDKNFGRTLADKNVEILDPATGTGTFITAIIDHIPSQQLVYKYQHEIHANEVAILPYYIANLNIEFMFKQKMGYYEEFKNLCFVDTLDNFSALKWARKAIDQGIQNHLFAISTENTERIKRQNTKKISVIIGNPPYNANQKNENENNKNREYPIIDQRIKDTYIKYSTAQKTKVYDMYARFLRWATDRIDKNGIVAFVSNSSFINSRTYDGFRKIVTQEFNEIWIVNLKGDARTSGERRRAEGGNVFSDLIRVGVAVYFLIKKEKATGCKIYYNAINDYVKAAEKKECLHDNKLQNLKFEKISPDKKNNWIKLADNDFEDLLQLASKDVKFGREKNALFELFTLGTVSNRDDWVYDFDKNNLEKKIEFFIEQYNQDTDKYKGKLDDRIAIEISKSSIKYTRELKRRLVKNKKIKIIKNEFRECLYRVFVKQNIYYASELNEMRYQTPLVFPKNKSENILIAINQSNKPFNILASKYLVDLHFNGDSQCLPFYRYDHDGNRTANITDWGLKQFRQHYQDRKINKQAIFHYVYAVLHHPAYRQKYELNLKREFPRIPFYQDFWRWANWGEQLLDWHINYETIEPYPLQRIDLPDINQPKAKLKADKGTDSIILDEQTTLTGVPAIAWDYKLGNRSALEWVLDQYKEKQPKDPTIAEKFHTYKFADYKDPVIDLLKRICTVSVATMKIIQQMTEAN